VNEEETVETAPMEAISMLFQTMHLNPAESVSRYGTLLFYLSCPESISFRWLKALISGAKFLHKIEI